MPTTRLPIVESLEPRSSSSDKDGLASNIFFEKAQNGVTYAVKRPGISSYAAGSGQAQGVFTWNDSLFQFMSEPNNSLVIAYVNSTFVILGYQYDGYFVSLISSNGRTWDRYVQSFNSATIGGNPTSIAYNGTVLCSTTSNGTPAKSLISSDYGVTWSSSNMPSNHDYVVASDGSGTFLAARRNSSSATVYTSTDGVTWTSRTIPGALTVTGVGFVLGLFVLVSSTGTTVYTSADGITWGTTAGAPTNSYMGRFTDNGSIAIGVSNSTISSSEGIYSSTDGRTWTKRESVSSLVGDGAWDGSKFVVCSGGVSIYTSTDGITWVISRVYESSSNYRIASSSSSDSVMIDSATARAKVTLTEDSGTTFERIEIPGQQIYSATII